MLVKVIFHGVLKKICPEEYEIDANTPAEAIRGVTNQFRDKLIRRDGKRFVCSVKECPNEINLTSGIRSDELNIFPTFSASGGGKRGWVTFAIGAVLVAATLLTFGAASVGIAAAWTAGMGSFWGSMGLMMGTSMMLSGLSQALFTPKIDTASSTSNPESSRTFGTPGNTTKIGTRIPVGYGIYKVSGQYISVNTQTVDKDSLEILALSKYLSFYRNPDESFLALSSGNRKIAADRMFELWQIQYFGPKYIANGKKTILDYVSKERLIQAGVEF